MMSQYILYAIIAMIFYGIAAIFYKIASPHIDSYSLTFITASFMALVAFVAWIFASKTITMQGFGWSALGGIIAGIGLLVFIIAVGLGDVSIATGIRGMSVAVTALIAIIFLSEKITVPHTIGLILAIVAIWLLST